MLGVFLARSLEGRVEHEMRHVASDARTQAFFGKDERALLADMQAGKLRVFLHKNPLVSGFASPGYRMFGHPETEGHRIYLNPISIADSFVIRHELRHYLHALAIEGLFIAPETRREALKRLSELVESSPKFLESIETDQQKAALAKLRELTTEGDAGGIEKNARQLAGLAFQRIASSGRAQMEAVGSMSDGGLLGLNNLLLRGVGETQAFFYDLFGGPSGAPPRTGYGNRAMLEKLAAQTPIDRFFPMA